ncbi:hypothetical protein EBX31_07925 [bacterium]|nr:hypothetical protein [bacterium]
MKGLKASCFARKARGWLYRRYPAWNKALFRKKSAGYERRWNLEEDGFTKEGFFRIFQKRVLSKIRPGKMYELGAGDGLVGSLGIWLENSAMGWEVEAWEHRAMAASCFARNRPRTPLHRHRLTAWSDAERGPDPVVITTHGCREASALHRVIRYQGIRPQLLGIWNPTCRPVWFHRFSRRGYQLCLVWHRTEFYLRR